MGTVQPVVESLNAGTVLKLVGKAIQRINSFEPEIKTNTLALIAAIDAAVTQAHPNCRGETAWKDSMGTLMNPDICALYSQLQDLLLKQVPPDSDAAKEFRHPEQNLDDPSGKNPSHF